MNRVEELVSCQENDQGLVSVRLELNGRFIKSQYVRKEYAPRILCRLVAGQIESLVKQRKTQVRMGYHGRSPEHYHRAFQMLDYRLASRQKWNCQVLANYLRLCLPDLKAIAPVKGRYAPVWRHFIIGLELIIQEEDINRKIQNLVYGRA